MTEGMRDTILTIYDEAISKNKAVRSICKMYNMPREDVLEILKEADREIPYQKKKTDPKQEEAAVPKDIPVANYIFEVMAEKLDELETQIKELEVKMSDLETKKKYYQDRYQTIVMYIQENNL